MSWNTPARALNPSARGPLPQSSHAVRKPSLTHHKKALKKTWGDVTRTPAAPAPASPIQTLSATTWAPWARTFLQGPFSQEADPRNSRDKEIVVCFKLLCFGVFCYMAIIVEHRDREESKFQIGVVPQFQKLIGRRISGESLFKHRHSAWQVPLFLIRMLQTLDHSWRRDWDI